MTVYRGAGKLFLSVCAALLATQPEVRAQGGREEHVDDCGCMSGSKQARCEHKTYTAETRRRTPGPACRP